MISNSYLVKRLHEIIVEQILKEPGRVLLPKEKIISTGLIDSFNLINLALIIEETLGVQIKNSELNFNSFDTISELAKLIEKRKNHHN